MQVSRHACTSRQAAAGREDGGRRRAMSAHRGRLDAAPHCGLCSCRRRGSQLPKRLPGPSSLPCTRADGIWMHWMLYGNPGDPRTTYLFTFVYIRGGHPSPQLTRGSPAALPCLTAFYFLRFCIRVVRRGGYSNTLMFPVCLYMYFLRVLAYVIPCLLDL